jgi:hypothetical protein
MKTLLLLTLWERPKKQVTKEVQTKLKELFEPKGG